MTDNQKSITTKITQSETNNSETHNTQVGVLSALIAFVFIAGIVAFAPIMELIMGVFIFLALLLVGLTIFAIGYNVYLAMTNK